MSDPPLIRMISEDPVLRNTKMIAEAWDCGGLMQVGAFPHYGGRWSEWNGKFRDTVRSFVKGQDGWAGAFAGALCGSPDVYNNNQQEDNWWVQQGGGNRWIGGRGPKASVNFVTAHDGFTLWDLVSYNEKHNEANGEGNRDGEEHNISWNCGVEGPTSDEKVSALRRRQQRNVLTALMMAHGVPMVLMGDEYGHTKHGNNNTYCHDDDLNWFNWEQCDDERDALVHFVTALLGIRRAHPELRRDHFPSPDDITWHGREPGAPDWGETSRLVAFTVSHPRCRNTLYVAFNAGHESVQLKLPPPGNQGEWRMQIDTAIQAPYDSLVEDESVGGPLSSSAVAAAQAMQAHWMAAETYSMMPYSTIVLENTASKLIMEQEEAEQQMGMMMPGGRVIPGEEATTIAGGVAPGPMGVAPPRVAVRR